jgi:hypothetical protein
MPESQYHIKLVDAVNFTFMQMILTRMHDSDYPGFYRDKKLSNKELEKYFEDHWELLANP